MNTRVDGQHLEDVDDEAMDRAKGDGYGDMSCISSVDLTFACVFLRYVIASSVKEPVS